MIAFYLASFSWQPSHAACVMILDIEIEAGSCIKVNRMCVEEDKLPFVLKQALQNVSPRHAYLSVAADSTANKLILVETILRRLGVTYTTKLGRAWTCNDTIVFDHRPR